MGEHFAICVVVSIHARERRWYGQRDQVIGRAGTLPFPRRNLCHCSGWRAMRSNAQQFTRFIKRL
jgi:hypothetical protein